MTNKFLQNVHSRSTYTENGALSNSSTGSELIDQFGKAGSHRGRSYREVGLDMSKLYGSDKRSALQFAFYLRMITRKIKGSVTTEKVQLGQGNRDEAFKRLLWVAENDATVFYDNLWLLPIVGSWKDMWVLMVMSRELGIRLELNKFYDLIAAAIEREEEKPLVQKFLPQIKAASKCTTPRAKSLNLLAKGFIQHVGWTPKQYRQFKSTGNAHVFQRVICNKEFHKLKWNQIPGRALSQLVSGKFLQNHDLESDYEKWLDAQPVAKFTGYVHELGDKVESAKTTSQIMTLNKQFLGVLKNNNPMIENGRRVIAAVDRSGSMTSGVAGGSTTAMNVAESLGVYFANLLPGPFKGYVIRFSSRSEWVKLTGTFVQQMKQMTWGDCPSNTDFQSVIDSICRVKKEFKNVPESDFPNTLLVVSDMQFDDSYSRRYGTPHSVETNYQTAITKLKAAGFSEEYVKDFQFIWWDVTSYGKDFPQTLSEPGGYFISGFDGAIISLIVNGEKTVDEVTGKVREKNIEEKVQDALNQEVLQRVHV